MRSKADLLFELGTEELPPKSLEQLSSSLKDGFSGYLRQQDLQYDSVLEFATPRRLGLIIKNLDLIQPDKTIEKRGPSFQASFDDSGQPTQAASGFARSCNINIEDLIRISNEQGEWIGHRFTQKGANVIDLLPQIAEESLNRLPIPKRMRWGNETHQFIRPVHWLLFLLGEEIVPCNLYGIASSKYTYGHRFHCPNPLEVVHASVYEETLSKSGFVIPDFNKRKSMITNQILSIAGKQDARVDIDENLLSEVTSLTEWPVAIEGNFDKEYLLVPMEALVLTMKKNQKYFPLFDVNDDLINKFITIANISSSNPDLIRKGNERVIRPRFSDAKFFWDQDGKSTLISRLDKLKTVLYQKDLGTMYDKTLRVRDLAVWIGTKQNLDIASIERSALLSRCDLVTEMVFEFPEMQGHMGKYQALRDGESAQVAEALFEFYLPRHSGDQLPSTSVGQCLALAERVDTVCGIFATGFVPTGDKDPYGLRRATIGFLRILEQFEFDLYFIELIKYSVEKQPNVNNADSLVNTITEYVLDRLKNIYTDKGISPLIIQAIYATNPNTLVEINHKIQALGSFLIRDDASDLIDTNKRIQNILKKFSSDQFTSIDPKLCTEDEEKNLVDKIRSISPQIYQHANLHQYDECLAILASVKPLVDNFFDKIMVMSDQLDLRKNRIAIIKSLQDQFLMIADLSHL